MSTLVFTDRNNICISGIIKKVEIVRSSSIDPTWDGTHGIAYFTSNSGVDIVALFKPHERTTFLGDTAGVFTFYNSAHGTWIKEATGNLCPGATFKVTTEVEYSAF